ncbi:MAG: hypothetical protein IKA36_00735, partial [Clostridia bacterium]|nr:hypothetical protein [Clostridia bacterium]
VIKLKKGDSIKYISGADNKVSLSVTTTTDKIVIPVKDIDVMSSISGGIKLISTKSDIILKAEIV